MSRIHMLLQGKGGVGKSFIASVLAQYKLAKGQKPLCIDTDPVNATFFGFKALKVQRLQLMDGEEINPRNFDALVELVPRPAEQGATPPLVDPLAPRARLRRAA